MEMYMSAMYGLLTIGVTLVVFVLIVVVLGGIIGAVIMVLLYPVSAFSSIRINDDRIWNSNICWSFMLLVGMVIVAPLGFNAASHVYKDMTKEPITQVTVREEVRSYIILDYTPPKHVYVTLRDKATGTSYERLYVAKHCSIGVRNGDVVNARITIYYNSNAPENHLMRFNDLSQVMCS